MKKERKPRGPHSEHTKLLMSEAAKRSLPDRLEQLSLGPEQRKQPVSINGIVYDSVRAAAEALGTATKTIRDRALSDDPKYSHYRYLPK